MKGDWTVGKGKQPFELKYNPENPQHAITILGDVTDDYRYKSHFNVILRNFPEIKHRTSTLGSFYDYGHIWNSN